jgi:NitT/TauT family transport system ATP-binding protein
MSTVAYSIPLDSGRTEVREALRFDNVTCTFAGNGKKAQTYTAVSEGNLTIGDGEFVSIVGPTGCGKSTLLNVAAGLTRPSSGSISVFGKKLTQGLNTQAAYLFQVDALMPWKTTEENIAIGLIFRGTPHEEALRAGLAQALALNPRIILMDEPFSALDIQTRHLMENELLQLWSHDRKSVMFVTHDLEEAISLSDRVIVLSAGPGTRPIAEFKIDLERPREMSEIRMTQRFLQLHTQIWDVLRGEVLKSYARNRV